MTINTLGAFTKMDTPIYPAFVNVSHDLSVDAITITVRQEQANTGTPPVMSVISLEPDDFARMMGEIIQNCDDDIKDRIIRYSTERD